MNKKYTAEELDLLHTELYDILGETIRVCQKHNIPYFVIGGTAIGALYDQAILPWADEFPNLSLKIPNTNFEVTMVSF
jgi:lipopolysaccharide cholinephosphotransferase